MKHILIVEDDEEIAMLERDYLEIEGFQTQVIADGEAAETAALSGQYDLILLDLMQITTGKLPYVFPLATQDITPYGNDVHHINSVLQPCTATKAPVVGIAITAEVMVPGCATGATHAADVEEAARFMLEVAKAFGRGQCKFYDEAEYARLVKLYGKMDHLQTLGQE